MSLEQAIEKLTAALEAATGVLVTQAATGKAPAATSAPAPAEGKQRPGRKPAAAPAADEGGGLDDEADGGGLGGGLDEGLGGDESGVTVEQAKAAVLAFRDRAIALKGKDEGLSATRTLMKKYVAALDDIDDEKAAAVHAAFTTAISKLKK
jgi:hypothetical protein